jgi:hypothetical protein
MVRRRHLRASAELPRPQRHGARRPMAAGQGSGLVRQGGCGRRRGEAEGGAETGEGGGGGGEEGGARVAAEERGGGECKFGGAWGGEREGATEE